MQRLHTSLISRRPIQAAFILHERVLNVSLVMKCWTDIPVLSRQQVVGAMCIIYRSDLTL